MHHAAGCNSEHVSLAPAAAAMLSILLPALHTRIESLATHVTTAYRGGDAAAECNSRTESTQTMVHIYRIHELMSTLQLHTSDAPAAPAGACDDDQQGTRSL